MHTIEDLARQSGHACGCDDDSDVMTLDDADPGRAWLWE